MCSESCSSGIWKARLFLALSLFISFMETECFSTSFHLFSFQIYAFVYITQLSCMEEFYWHIIYLHLLGKTLIFPTCYEDIEKHFLFNKKKKFP